MAILSLAVTSLMTSIQSAQANIRQARLKALALLQCNAALEEIRFAWSLDMEDAVAPVPRPAYPRVNTLGVFTELSPTSAIPEPDTSVNAPSVAYRARFHETGGPPGAWHPALPWAPAGAPPPCGGILVVEVQSYEDHLSHLESIATLTAFLAREP